MDRGWHEILRFLESATGLALAFLVVALVLLIAPMMKILFEPAGIVADVLRRIIEAITGKATVNVHFRDKHGELMVLGKFIVAVLINGHGRPIILRQGIFDGGDPEYIKLGARVTVLVQDGKVEEKLVIQLDDRQQHLFVQSKYGRKDLLKKICETDDQ
jgi:hypothetical protein